MVYNAMKLFIEVNPQLFDECSHEYTETQNNAEARKRERQAKWDNLTNLATTMRGGKPPPKTITHTSRGIQGPPLMTEPNRIDDIDPLGSHGGSKRLENLRLSDDGIASPPFESQASANAARS